MHFSSKLFCLVSPSEKTKRFKLKTGTALISVIAMISACKNQDSDNSKIKDKRNSKIEKPLQKSMGKSTARLSKYIYLHLITCVVDKLHNSDNVQNQIESIESEAIDQTPNNNNYDARCYMPPPIEDSILYEIE